MFHTLRQLRSRDEKVDETRKETDRILNTVEEGLFLIDEKLKIGDQYSSAMESIFSTNSIAGESFLTLIANVVNKRDLITAENFLELLFDKTKNYQLLIDLNPLTNLPIYIENNRNNSELRVLKFAFKPILRRNQVDQVLVSVTDKTEPSLLKKHLADERRRGEQRMNILSDILAVEKNVLPQFVNNSLSNLNRINDILKQLDISAANKIESISPLINNIKIEAKAFKLDSFSGMASELEQTLNAIKAKPNASGENFTPLTVMLNQMISNVEVTCQLPDIEKTNTETQDA